MTEASQIHRIIPILRAGYHDKLSPSWVDAHLKKVIFLKNYDMVNPIAGLEKLWKIGERIAVFTAVMIVSGTIGYVSLHALA